MDNVVSDFLFGILAYYPLMTFTLVFPYLAWRYMGAKWLDTRWAPSWIRGARYLVVGLIFVFGITAPYFVASYFGVGPQVPDSAPHFVGYRRGVPLELLPFGAGMFVVAIIPHFLSFYLNVLDAVISKIDAMQGDGRNSEDRPRRFLTPFERSIDNMLGRARYIHTDALNINDIFRFHDASEGAKRKVYQEFSKTRFLILLRRKLELYKTPRINALYTPPGKKRVVIVAEDEWNLGGMFHRTPYATITGEEIMGILSDEHVVVIRQRGLVLHIDMKTLRGLGASS